MALTNQDRWTHFSVFVPLPAPTPLWNRIRDVESCATILHNSILPLLEAQLPGNQMFFFPLHLYLALSLSPLHPHPLYTLFQTLKYPRNCIIERHSRSPTDHHKAHNNSNFVFLLPPSLCRIDYHGLSLHLHSIFLFLVSPSFGQRPELTNARSSHAATLVDRQLWELRRTNRSNGVWGAWQ